MAKVICKNCNEESEFSPYNIFICPNCKEYSEYLLVKNNYCPLIEYKELVKENLPCEYCIHSYFNKNGEYTCNYKND